jgi:hypothetical protein
MGDRRRTRARGSYWNARGSPSNALFPPVSQFVFSGKATNTQGESGFVVYRSSPSSNDTPLPRCTFERLPSRTRSLLISLRWRTWMPVRRSRSA